MNLKALFLTTTLILGVVKLGSARHGNPVESAGRAPVLLELFTSEGCSSCPSADRLLQKLDRKQPVDGADLIVLSEHVDYWNHLGWVDPYSSAEFSKRQQDYASLLGSEVYTPQLVIDGRRQAVGSDQPAIENAIHDSLRSPKIPVAVSAKREADEVEVHLDVAPVEGRAAASVYLVLAADEARSHVMRGENAGRELEHVAVVQSLVKVADLSRGSALQKDVRAAFKPLVPGGNLRVVVFVQDRGSRRIIGVGQNRL